MVTIASRLAGDIISSVHSGAIVIGLGMVRKNSTIDTLSDLGRVIRAVVIEQVDRVALGVFAFANGRAGPVVIIDLGHRLQHE